MRSVQGGDAGSDWRGAPGPDTIESMETIEAPSGVRRVADLRLRGEAGTIPVRVRWPRSRSAPPIVVFLPDAAPADGVSAEDDALGHELSARVGAVVLCVPWAPRQPGALDRAEAALMWAADHGDELGADPGRLVVAGHGAGAAAAAALALRAHDRGWPPLRRQVLILGATRRPASYAAASVPAAGAPAAAILVGQSERCAEWLRATGADVEEVRDLADLATSLRTALEER